MKKQQRGGTIVGFILGVIVGLGAALAVAVYVTKVPVPFLNKSTPRASEQDEATKNKNWDPNAPLYGKNPVRPAAPAAAPASDTATAAAQPASGPRAAASRPGAAPTSADPLGDLARAKANAAPAPATSADPFEYFVQAGAFRTQQDADAQRAKLAMLGWEARVSEREQNGRTVFRVRVGPFNSRAEADKAAARIKALDLSASVLTL